MAKIELSIHRDYVPGWGVWEGVREIVQNALDENDRGNRISVKHSGDVLTVSNEGSDLQIQHLLIGFSTKVGQAEMRGEKGEGLDLALLALCRSGYDVTVRTIKETWTPELSRSEKWGADVLFINTREVQKPRTGTSISVKGISADMWSELGQRFIDFREHDAEERVKTYDGEILTSVMYSGKVFVKGIFVMDDPQLRYGYNLFRVKLDRDRRMVDSFDLGWAMAKILSDAVSKYPDRLAKSVWQMISDECKDTSGISDWNTGPEFKALMGQMFSTEHGEEAVPVANIGESEVMDSLGRRGIVAPRVMRDVVKSVLDTPEQVKVKMAGSTRRAFSWHELDADEQSALKAACVALDDALDAFRVNPQLCHWLGVSATIWGSDKKTMDRLEIVEFNDSGLRGMALLSEGRIKISRDVLRGMLPALNVIIHEMAHLLSGEVDAKHGFESALGDIWAAVCWSMSESGKSRTLN